MAGPQPLEINTRRFSCWVCKHFQPAYFEGELSGAGECRAIPPLPVQGDDVGEPVFPVIKHGALSWCSAWMQSRTNLGTPPPIIP
jgi:hypothetical protein